MSFIGMSVDMRSMPTAPAQVEADAVLRQSLQRLVQRLDANGSETFVLLHRRLRYDGVPIVRDRGIVNLKNEPGIDDCLVFFMQRIGAGEHELLVGLVVAISEARRAARSDRTHEALLDAVCGEGGFEICDVGGNCRLSLVSDRTGANRPRWPLRAGRDAMIWIGIGTDESGAVAPFHQVDEHEFVRSGLARWSVDAAAGGNFEAVETGKDVAQPSPVVDALAHRFSELSVIGNRDAKIALKPHRIRDRRCK